jgi:hypothetical protein
MRSVVDEGRQRVERGRLTRTGTARDDDVEAGGDRGLKIRRHLFGEGAEIHQVVDAQLFLLELTNGDERAIHANRRHHGVETRAVLETGVDIGVRFVDAATHGGHDLVDDAQQVAFILEPHIRQFQRPARSTKTRLGR